MKKLKGAKHKKLKGVLVILIGNLNAKNGATVEAVMDRAKEIVQ
jgi:hypothetical protein